MSRTACERDLLGINLRDRSGKHNLLGIRCELSGGRPFGGSLEHDREGLDRKHCDGRTVLREDVPTVWAESNLAKASDYPSSTLSRARHVHQAQRDNRSCDSAQRLRRHAPTRLHP